MSLYNHPEILVVSLHLEQMAIFIFIFIFVANVDIFNNYNRILYLCLTSYKIFTTLFIKLIK